jgi:hypothetical protein
MHGLTNFQQSKALYERGYRHPEPVRYHARVPLFSLADMVTMQGIIYHKPDDTPMPDIIQSYVESCLSEPDSLVELANQRLRDVYK